MSYNSFCKYRYFKRKMPGEKRNGEREKSKRWDMSWPEKNQPFLFDNTNWSA
jgi:hypothetical protein